MVGRVLEMLGSREVSVNEIWPCVPWAPSHPFHDFYVTRVESGMRPTMARLTLARKIAAITLTMWKKGVSFDPKQLQRQAA